MSGQHTPEPWKVVNRGDDDYSDIDANGSGGWTGDVTVAMNIGNDNARRIVACVNACVGFPTEELEAYHAKHLGDFFKNIALRLEAHELVKQRDELKSALDDIAEIAAKYSGDYPLQVLTIASEAIACVKEKP